MITEHSLTHMTGIFRDHGIAELSPGVSAPYSASQPPDGHYLGYERQRYRDARRRGFTGHPLGATAAPLRPVSPDALSMSALSAHEPGGAHATGQPTEQAWSSHSHLPPASLEEPWRAKLTAPLLRLLIPRHAKPADVGAQKQSRFRAYSRTNDADSIANAAKHIPCAASRLNYGRSRAKRQTPGAHPRGRRRGTTSTQQGGPPRPPQATAAGGTDPRHRPLPYASRVSRWMARLKQR